MKFVACVLVALLACAHGQEAPVTTSTQKPTTTTTTATTTTTTTAPTTTTTTKPTTTTTTPAPTPKPTPAPTPAPPSPAPAQTPEFGVWNVTDPSSNTTACLRAQFELHFVVPYAVKGAKDGYLNATVIVPANATSRGDCESLMLVWPAANGTGTNFLTLNFSSFTPVNQTKPEYVLKSATATLFNDPERFRNATDAMTPFELKIVDRENLFAAPANNSYRCSSTQNVAANSTTPIVPGPNNTVIGGTFVFKSVQLQAMIPKTSTGFSSAITCPLDRELTSDIVPIAVGCALAGLVVVVIVAYIIGRRRSRQSGYTSV